MKELIGGGKVKTFQSSLEAAAILREVSGKTGLAESLIVTLVVKVQKLFRRKRLVSKFNHLISAYSVVDAGLDIKKRHKVLLEIVDTERSYVSNMEECLNSFLEPLLASKILSESEVESIFWNFHEVYQHNKILLTKLQAAMKAWPEQNNLTTIFLNLGKMLAVYEEYIVHYQISITSLKELIKENEAFSKFLKKKRKALGGWKTLNSYYLIMPIQRLPRYQLLLKELYKYTPEIHVDRVDIGRAVERMIQVNHCINEKQKAIAASQEDLVKLVGMEKLLEDPKAWRTSNIFIKHQGNIDVEIDGKDRQTVFCLMLPRSLVFTRKPSKKQVQHSTKDTQGKPIWGKAFYVICWDKIVDICTESLDTFEIVFFSDNLYSSFKITTLDEKWKSSFVSLLPSPPEIVSSDPEIVPSGPETVSTRSETVSRVSSVTTSFRAVFIPEKHQAEGKYHISVELEGLEKVKLHREVERGYLTEFRVWIPYGVSNQASVVIIVSSVKPKVKMGEVRISVLHCRRMVEKTKDKMNNHPILLRKKKVGALRLIVDSRGVGTPTPRLNASRRSSSTRSVGSFIKEKPEPVEVKDGRKSSLLVGSFFSQSIGCSVGSSPVQMAPEPKRLAKSWIGKSFFPTQRSEDFTGTRSHLKDSARENLFQETKERRKSTE